MATDTVRYHAMLGGRFSLPLDIRWSRSRSFALAPPTSASAAGDGELNSSLFETGEGYGLVSAGVGLAGRREDASAGAAVTSGTIALSGIPADAAIRRAYLYRVIYGSALDS